MNLQERNEKQRTFFTDKIDVYDLSHEEFMNTKKYVSEALNPNTIKILDLGAGTGLELIHLYELYPNAQVTVIDITESMLKRLKERLTDKDIEIICGDFFKVDFKSGYDAVISTSALHHFKKEEKISLYKKIYDSLNIGGLFINCDKVSPNKEEEARMFYELENNIDNYKHIDTPLTIENEVAILNNSKFSSVEVFEVDRNDYRLFKSKK